MLVAITILSVIGASIAVAVATQWRSHDALADGERSRQALRDAANVVLSELRSVSPSAGDIISLMDTAIEVRATLGASVICSVTVARDEIMVPPRSPTVGAPLSWWRDWPTLGDSVAILDARAGLPDTISRHEIVDISGGVCPISSGFVRSAADAATSVRFALWPALPASIGAGAPLTFLRRARYSIYRSSTDGRWYFGIKEQSGGAWTVVQPLAGPFSPPAASGTGGMALVVRDSSGSVFSAAPYGSAASIDLVLRSTGRLPPRALGRSTAVAESLRITLSPRNQ
jgi:hypothetical protein